MISGKIKRNPHINIYFFFFGSELASKKILMPTNKRGKIDKTVIESVVWSTKSILKKTPGNHNRMVEEKALYRLGIRHLRFHSGNQ